MKSLRLFLPFLFCAAVFGFGWTSNVAGAESSPKGTPPTQVPAPPVKPPAKPPVKPPVKPPAPGSLDAYLAQLDRSNRTIRTLRVPYVQVRKVRISRRLRKASGRFVMEIRKAPLGPRILFEETKPHRMDLLFTDTKVVFRDKATGRIDVRDPRKGGVRPSEIWVIGRPLTELKKHFTISLVPRAEKEKKTSMAKLRFVPRSKKVQKWVKELFIWLRPGDALPLKTKVVSPSGEYQTFTFQADRLERNVRLDPSTFALESAVPTKSG
jgi:hypothetical protein